MGQRRSSLLAVVAVFAVAACGGADNTADAPATVPEVVEPVATTPAQVTQLPEGVTGEMVARGREIFTTSTCYTCHGADGAGTPLAPSLLDQTWLNTDGTYEGIINIVTNGVPTPVQAALPMPPMGGAPLTTEQIRDVAAYVYTLSHGS